LVVAFQWVLGSCSFSPLPEKSQIADFGRFEAYEPAADMQRVMIGAPHGATEPIAVE
jgi:hypothetical protein